MEIPDDIAFHILSKLPLKSLKRFSLVRKSWADLLEIPHFMSTFRSNFLSKHDSYYDDTSSLLLSQLQKSAHDLGSFNFSSEVFFTTLLPLGLADNRMVQKCLEVLNGSIVVISNHEETTIFHIWILGELGVKESWTKLFIVGPLHGVGLPIGVGRKGDIFFRKQNGELALFDLSTQMFKEMVAKGMLDEDHMIIHQESILPIGRTSY